MLTVPGTGVSAFVMMVIAVKIRPDLKRSVDIPLSRLPDTSGSAADDLYPGIAQSIDRAAADTAANKEFDLFQCQQCGKRTMPGIAAGKHFFTCNFTVFDFKHRKSRSMPEVLKYLTVFTCYCDFHNFDPALFILFLTIFTARKLFAVSLRNLSFYPAVIQRIFHPVAEVDK